MNPTHVRLRGVTRFDDLELDLRDFPTGLIAVVGPNGAGKTTLLECMAPAPLLLEFPSRPGPLKDWLRGRDALIEVELEHGGSTFRSVVQVDVEYSAGRGKTEAFLFQDGEPVNDGKVRTYRAAVERLFPSRPVLLASAFAAQDGTGSWGALSVAERKDLFAELLALGRYQELADRAKEHRKHCDALLVDHERDVEDLARKEERAVAIREELDVTRPEAARAGDLIESRVDVAARLEAELRTLEERSGDTARLRSELGALERDVEDLRRKVRLGRERLAELPALQERVEALRRYQTQATQYEAEIRRLDGVESSARRDRTQATQDRDQVRRDLRKVEEAVPHVQRGEDKLQDLQREVGALDLDPERPGKAAAALREAEEAHRRIQRDHETRERELEEANRKAELLERVPCKGNTFYLGNPLDDAEAVDCGTCDFLQEARTAAGSVQVLAHNVAALGLQVIEATATLASAREEAAAVEEIRRKAEDLAGQIRDVRVWLDANRDAPARAAELRDRVAELDARIEAAGETLNQARRDRETDEGRLRVARTKVEALPGLEDALRTSQAEEGALPQREELLAERDARRARLAVDLAGREPVPEEELQAARREAQEARSLVARAKTHKRDMDLAVGRLEGLLEALGDLAAARKDLERAAGDLERRRAGFRLVEQGLGRNGVQALEIDAAGPEVSRLTNALLEELTGGRFQVALRTVQEARGGRKAKEVFDLQVHDSVRGRVGSLGGLSGGEQVVISEALKLALAVFNAGQWGSPLRTLWRDECDGALDPFHVRPRFPAMLRAARELGGFDRVFFVTHDTSVAEQADGILYVADGQARLVAPGELP